MWAAMRRFWANECGAVIATDWVFVATIMVLGSVTALASFRQGIINDLTAMTSAVTSVNDPDSSEGPHVILDSADEFDRADIESNDPNL